MEERLDQQPQIVRFGAVIQFEAEIGIRTEQGHKVGRFGAIFLILVDPDPHVIQTHNHPGGVKTA